MKHLPAATRTIGVAGLVLVVALSAGCKQRKPRAAASQGEATSDLAFVGPAGTYRSSCHKSAIANGQLQSECLQPDGQHHRSTINVSHCHGDIGNQNGVLVCNGAIAEDRGLVTP